MEISYLGHLFSFLSLPSAIVCPIVPIRLWAEILARSRIVPVPTCFLLWYGLFRYVPTEDNLYLYTRFYIKSLPYRELNKYVFNFYKFTLLSLSLADFSNTALHLEMRTLGDGLQ